MCIDLEGHHSGGSSFVNVNYFCYYRNCLYNHRYKFSFEKEQVNESQWIVSRPGPGSDPPFGSDQYRGMTGLYIGHTFSHLHTYSFIHFIRLREKLSYAHFGFDS